jgi:predicted amidohydrolase
LAPTTARNTISSTCLFTLAPTLKETTFQNSNSNIAKHIGPGIIAGILSTLVTQPLDTIKTQMQGTIDNTTTRKTIYDIYHSSTKFQKKGAVSAFYRGLLPRLCSSTLSLLILDNTRHYMTQYFTKADGKT